MASRRTVTRSATDKPLRASTYASKKVLTYIIHMYIKVHVYPVDSAIWRLDEETQCGILPKYIARGFAFSSHQVRSYWQYGFPY